MSSLFFAKWQRESCPSLEALTICRCIYTLLDVTNPAPDVEAVQSLNDRYKSAQGGALADVSVFLNASEYHKELLTDFSKVASGSKAGVRKLLAMMTELEDASLTLADFVPCVDKALKLIQELKVCLRQGATTHLEAKVLAKLTMQWDRLPALPTEELKAERDCLHEFATVLDEVQVMWPGNRDFTEMAMWVQKESAAQAEMCLWQNLMDAIAATGGPEGTILTNMFPAVDTAVEKLEGCTAPESELHNISAWFDEAVTYMLEKFPDGQEASDIFNRIVALMGSEQDIQKERRSAACVVHASHEAKAAQSAYLALATPQEDRWCIDKTQTLLKKVLQKKATLLELLEVQQKAKLQVELSTGASAAVNNLETFVEETMTWCLAHAKEKLLGKIEAGRKALSWDGGDTPGPGRWQNSVLSQTSLQEVLDLAKDTLMKLDLGAVVRQEKDITAHVKELKRVAGVFGHTPERQVLSEATSLAEDLKLVQTEGLLVAAFTKTDMNLKDLKSKVVGIKKQCPEVIWGRVCGQLLNRAIAAQRLRAA